MSPLTLLSRASPGSAAPDRHRPPIGCPAPGQSCSSAKVATACTRLRPSCSTSASHTVRCSPRVRTRAVDLQPAGLPGAQVGDGELAGRRHVAVVGGAADRRAHRRVHQRGEDAAVHRARRVEVFVGRLEAPAARLPSSTSPTTAPSRPANPPGPVSSLIRDSLPVGAPPAATGRQGCMGRRGRSGTVRYRFESSGGRVKHPECGTGVGEALRDRTTSQRVHRSRP